MCFSQTTGLRLTMGPRGFLKTDNESTYITTMDSSGFSNYGGRATMGSREFFKTANETTCI